MGIHEFADEDTKIRLQDGNTLSSKLANPAQVLDGIDQVRDTFLTGAQGTPK